MALGSVREYDDGRPLVAIELDVEDDALRARWLDLPIDPHILEALEPCRDRGVVLRYAALDAGRTRAENTTELARWGAQLAHAFGVIASAVPEGERGRFARPIVAIDLDDHVRVGFRSVAPDDLAALAPDVRAAWPRCSEAGLVHLVGTHLAALAGDRGHLAPILDRCLDPDPAKRDTLDGVRASLLAAVGIAGAGIRRGLVHAAWSYTEAGLGWAALGRFEDALASFERALAIVPTARARAGRNAALEALGRPSDRAPDAAAWAEVALEGRLLERERAFDRALERYATVRRDRAILGALFTAIARCHLALGNAGHVVDYAGRALTADPTRAEARRLQIRGLALDKQPREALDRADAWIAIAPDDGVAHYERGRCLIALGRPAEAAACFARAAALQPDLVEATLLRLEIERGRGAVRRTVGEEPERAAVLGDGRAADAIAILQGPRYASDASAQRSLGNCLAYERRFAEALAVYERIGATTARAFVLLELDRAAEALAIFEGADDLEALEGRARALEQLGRTDEAAAVHAQLVERAAHGSELRLRSAR